jgi:antitoxin (DNA-binding transcriptional repressor) of toxin-antitoxin stability system
MVRSAIVRQPSRINDGREIAQTLTLSVMDQVLRSGESVVITKHGKPVAKLVPAESQADGIFGYMAGRVKIVGDIVGPITPLEDWESK